MVKGTAVIAPKPTQDQKAYPAIVAAGAMKAVAVAGQAKVEQDTNKELCPRCGCDKFKTVTFFDEKLTHEKKTVPVLVCNDCTEDYKRYRAQALANNIKLVVSDPTAPEPPAPLDKFRWVLQETTPDQLQNRAQAAQAAYRLKYDNVVVSVLKQRGYIDGESHWEGSTTTRPVMRFTQESFSSGIATGLRNALEKQQALSLLSLRWYMKNAAQCLEEGHQTRVAQFRKELEAKLAGPATPSVAQPTTTPDA